MLRIAGWVTWQLFVLLLAFLVYANLFSEYGVYDSHPVADGIAAVVFLLLALFLGTLPVRRWRRERRDVARK
jgi:predicted transporter